MRFQCGLCAAVLSSVLVTAASTAENRPVIISLPAVPGETTLPEIVPPKNQTEERCVDISLQWLRVKGEVAQIPAIQQVFDKTFGPNKCGGVLTAVRAKTFLQVCKDKTQVTLGPEVQMRLVLGRQGRLIDGEFLDVTNEGKLKPKLTDNENYRGPCVGISVLNTVTEVQPDVLHLDLQFEQTYLTKPLKPGTIAKIQERHLNEVVNIASGRTYIMPCGKVRQPPLELENNCELFLAVTAKLVD